MHPAAGVHKVHPRSGGPLDARVASSRFHLVAQSRGLDDGQVGDLNYSVVSPSDTCSDPAPDGSPLQSEIG